MVVTRQQDLQEAADAIAAGRFDAALKTLESLSDAFPERDALLGQAYLGRKDARLAVEFLRGSLQNQPDDLQILMRLGHAYLFTGDTLEELELLASNLAKTLNCLQPVKTASIATDCCDACLKGFWGPHHTRANHLCTG